MKKFYIYGIIVIALVAVLIATVQLTDSQSAAVLDAVSGIAGQSQTIAWSPSDFPADKVTINLIRKTGDNPVSYELVRTIDAAAVNNGLATWTPSENEVGSDVFIEIGCPASAEACRSTMTLASR